MSSITISESRSSIQAAHPNFIGIIRGELFKIWKTRSVWITFILLLAFLAIPYLFSLLSHQDLQNTVTQTPAAYFFEESSNNLELVRSFIGLFLIILTATVFGREYQLGTIRILLARGIGRLQLFSAKLVAIVLLAIITLIICLLLTLIMQLILLDAVAGNLNALSSLPSGFWADMWTTLLTILISMGVTILMAVTAATVGRSLAFSMTFGLLFFPADNIGTLFMSLGYRLTGNDFWKNITAYFLGPNLNQMPIALLPTSAQPFALSSTPLVNVDGTHTLLVALVYAIIFAAVSIVLTWKRDVRE